MFKTSSKNQIAHNVATTVAPTIADFAANIFNSDIGFTIPLLQ